jgi:hypothetical protein
MTTTNALECICSADQTPGTYAVGCPRHIAIELERGPYARPRTQSFTVTYYRAEVAISTPVLGDDGNVWSQTDYVTCDHHHTTLEGADACAVKLARKHGRTSK